MKSLPLTKLSPHPGETDTCTLVALNSQNDKRNTTASKPGIGCPSRYVALKNDNISENNKSTLFW